MGSRHATLLTALLGLTALGCHAQRSALEPSSDSIPPSVVSASPIADTTPPVVPDAAAASDLPPAPMADASAAEAAPRVPYRALAVATGEIHTCAILDDHRLKCWGDNSQGQLGLDDPRELIGGSPSEMGDALPFVDLGTGRTAVAVAGSRYSTCAILDDGSVKCWGWGGLNGLAKQFGKTAGDMGDHLPALALGPGRATHLGMGNTVACASLDSGEIWCWGGTPASSTPARTTVLPAGRSVTMMSANYGEAVLALLDDGSVLPLAGGKGLSFPAGRKAVAIGGSAIVACAILDDATLSCDVDSSPDYLPATRDVVAFGDWTASEGAVTISSDGSVRGGQIFCGAPGGPPSPWCYEAGGSVPLGQRAVALTSGGQNFGCVLLADGGIKCWGPATAPWLGSDVSFADSGGTQVIAGWHEVDLGTH
jgi:hypothetical protein